MSQKQPPSTDVITPTSEPPVDLKLRIVAGPDFGKELELVRGTYRVGKGPDCELRLVDPAVSGTHLIVEVLPDRLRLVDAGSKNGSYCRGLRITTHDVRAGDEIVIGRSTLKVLPRGQPGPPLPPSTRTRFGELVGSSLAMRQLFAQLERISASDADVLVSGETGTGKEICARAIHGASARRAGPFIVCDLAAVSPQLVESELFGHVRGAFTGASGDRAGLFELANGGTVFLDEVAELPLELQPRLLRVLENRTVRRVGAAEATTLDVRVVAATHRDLPELVRQGRFREDLFHRLSVLHVHLPPLRERREDVPLLVDQMLASRGLSPSVLGPATRAQMQCYDWPGNVRELRNAVERALALGVERAGLSDSAERQERAGPSLSFREAKERMLASFERDYLVELLRAAGGNIRRAAREASIDRAHLYRLLKKHGLGG